MQVKFTSDDIKIYIDDLFPYKKKKYNSLWYLRSVKSDKKIIKIT